MQWYSCCVARTRGLHSWYTRNAFALFVHPTWALGGSSQTVHLVELASGILFSALAFYRVEWPGSSFRHKSVYMLMAEHWKEKHWQSWCRRSRFPSMQWPVFLVTSLAKNFLVLHCNFLQEWKIVQEQQTMEVSGRHLQLSLLIALCWKKLQSYQLHVGGDI